MLILPFHRMFWYTAGLEVRTLKVLLEIIRAGLITLVLGAVFNALISRLYVWFGLDIGEMGWLINLGILILIFVLYQNKFQFSGWNHSFKTEKLTSPVTTLLIGTAAVLILMPLMITSAGPWFS
ncbi:hypothetical protein CR205_03575 [Alteribacter lacisalsi]|uniref:Uncharacterized protein n=1 Tax=Alteribacter lacisalsi TaxID=2045244 RepID=A0A2W0HJK5_9BACI|nr:hypothetical protein [Alteribacter lacisalsi]PYZ97685.1 hypothetical protein CR205_03575 [Alteribacter lacisalsi]